MSIRPDLNRTLVPSHEVENLRKNGIDLDKFQPITITQATTLE